MTKIELATKIAWSYLGKPYLWGGDDPVAGFDCSGLVIELLKSVGLLGRNDDMTAAMLYQKFKQKEQTVLEEGCLVFWADLAGKIIHVEYCISDELTIGASGGGSKTITEKDAIDQNAYIKVRPILGRSNPVAKIVNPFKL